jgi:hypothetical protein
MIYDGIYMHSYAVGSVLMLGQSNMAGRGNMGEVKPIRNPLCYMLRMGRWQPMCEPVNPDRGIFEGRFRSGISLAASFADEYARCFQSPVGLIPCADGGTSLDEWMPGQLLYDHAVMQTKLAQRTSQLKAILWHQGESDCLCDETVAAYREKFLRMITQLRKDLGAENVPVILGELPQQMGANWKTEGRERQLNAILRQLAQEVPGCAIASSVGLSMKTDGAHFDALACREFGKRYFEVYQTLL